MSCQCHGARMSMFGEGEEGPAYGPEYRPDLLGPDYGPEYRPAELFLSQYKWWLVGGGVGLFLLAGGSILGLSLRKRSSRRRR